MISSLSIAFLFNSLSNNNANDNSLYCYVKTVNDVNEKPDFEFVTTWIPENRMLVNLFKCH